jgi:DNA (cytosine-5)-methyltransferase 3A
MIWLSLFDGISCGRLAIERVGLEVEGYISSEIDPNAIKVSNFNFPETIQIGDVTKVKSEDLPKVDILMGGSPCQGFSLSGKQLNFDDPRSKLFFEFLRLLEECKPKYFLLENVKMKKDFQDIISNYLGVEPIYINSKLVSAQSRGRLYWTNIPVKGLPEDRCLFIKDILEKQYPERVLSNEEITRQLGNYLQTSKYRDSFLWEFDTTGRILVMRPDRLKIQRIGRVGFPHHKTEILTEGFGVPFVFDGENIRPITIIEAERLQTLPEGYTDVPGISESKRFSMIGNGWTVDVISFILSFIKSE